MSFKILPIKEFSKDFGKLDRYLQERILEKVGEVAQNPERYKHLRRDLFGSSRIIIGKLRIIFSYDVSKQELYLEKIVFGHKY